jgi:hypothetical protein
MYLFVSLFIYLFNIHYYNINTNVLQIYFLFRLNNISNNFSGDELEKTHLVTRELKKITKKSTSVLTSISSQKN